MAGGELERHAQSVGIGRLRIVRPVNFRRRLLLREIQRQRVRRAAAGAVSPAFFTGGTGLNRYGVKNITAPIRRNASSSRTSIDISFLGAGLPLPPFTESDIQRDSVRITSHRTGSNPPA